MPVGVPIVPTASTNILMMRSAVFIAAPQPMALVVPTAPPVSTCTALEATVAVIAVQLQRVRVVLIVPMANMKSRPVLLKF